MIQRRLRGQARGVDALETRGDSLQLPTHRLLRFRTDIRQAAQGIAVAFLAGAHRVVFADELFVLADQRGQRRFVARPLRTHRGNPQPKQARDKNTKHRRSPEFGKGGILV